MLDSWQTFLSVYFFHCNEKNTLQLCVCVCRVVFWDKTGSMRAIY